MQTDEQGEIDIARIRFSISAYPDAGSFPITKRRTIQLLDKIEALQRERDEAQEIAANFTQVERFTAMNAERDRLREVLEGILSRQGYGEPKLSSGSPLPDSEVVNILCTMGDLRKARAALSPTNGGDSHG